VTEPADTVALDVRRVVESPTASGKIVVSGYVYDVGTGLLTRVIGPVSRNHRAA
jgi:carbonic anhydrase